MSETKEDILRGYEIHRVFRDQLGRILEIDLIKGDETIKLYQKKNKRCSMHLNIDCKECNEKAFKVEDTKEDSKEEKTRWE